MNNDKLTIGLFIDVFYPMTDGVTMVVDNYAKRLSKFCNVIVFAPKYIVNTITNNCNYETNIYLFFSDLGTHDGLPECIRL